MKHISERRKTIRRKNEEALRKSEEKYRALLDNASDAILLANEEGNLLEVNKKAEELLGYTRKELLGVNISKIHPQEELEKIINGFKETNKKGLGTVNNTAVLRKDGTTVSVDISGSVIEYSGEKVLQGIFRDITERKQAEETLRKSGENFRLSLDDSPLGIRIVTAEGETIYANRAILDIYGYDSIEELKGTPLKNRYTPESYAEFQIRKEKRERGEFGPSEYGISIVRKNGEVRHVQAFRKEIFWNGAKQFQVIYQDITERKRAEEALFQSEEKYRNFVERANDGIGIAQDGILRYANTRLAQIGGYSVQELIGKPFIDFFTPEEVPKVLDRYKRRMAGKKVVSIYETALKHKNGNRVDVEVNAGVITYEGKPADLVLVRDITERKQAEKQIFVANERLQYLLSSSSAVIYAAKPSGEYEATFISENVAPIVGYNSVEFIRDSNFWFNHIHPEDQPIILVEVPKLFENEFHSYEYRFRCKDGKYIWVNDQMKLVRDNDGNPVEIIGLWLDITERKRTDDALKKNQEELIKKNQEIEESRRNVQITLERLGNAYEELKASQAKILQQEKMASIGQLAAGVAHEINNPMAFIESNLGTLNKYIRRLKDFIQAQSEAIKSLKATEAIEKLEKKRKELKLDYTIDDIDLLVKESRDGLERVQKIVRELNLFSRVDDAEYKDTNINECIENSINIVWNELKQKATLHKDYGNLPQTKCYPQKLNQVLINLLVNAIQAIEKRGKIKIKTWEKDGSIWVTVSDTGCGISKENQGKIFEPFFTTKEAGKGTGLGLSISYEIMQRHKGDISFESKKGKETTFTIRIPIV